MKKLSFSLLAALVASLSFTACHDDDEDEKKGPREVVVDLDNAQVSDPKLSLATALGIPVYTYEWSEASGLLSPSNISVYEFNSMPADSVTGEMGKSVGYYGGIRPTWFPANDDDQWFVPACEEGATASFRSGNGCLIANPGILARALFRKGLLTMGKKMKGFWVNNTELLDYSVCNGYTGEDDTSLDFPALKKGEEIILQVYGYKFELKDLKNIEELFKKNKEALKGNLAKQTVTLASNDGEKTTVLRDWTWVDLSDIAECQVFEIDMQLKGRPETEPQLNDYLKRVLIDDITIIED